MLRSYLVIFGVFIWILFSIFWVYPLKRELQKTHGFDKSNDYFSVLANVMTR